MNDIIIKNLSKSYGEKVVLNNYSETFPANKISIIMGESGCGKTTLSNILLGEIQGDAGEIIGLPQTFSVVFQENRLCEDFCVFSNIRMVLNEKHKNNIENIRTYIYEILERLNIKDLSKQKVKSLSGGQKRRVALARAIAYDAEVFILDEAFKGLDEKNLYTAMEYMKEVLRDKTAIIITHDKKEADFFEGEIKELKMHI